MSHGRPPVNFPQPTVPPRAPARSADARQDGADAAAEVDESARQRGQIGENEEPARSHLRPASEEHLYQAASLLNSLKPQAQPECAQRLVPSAVRRPPFPAHHGQPGSKSQRQSAAGALVAKAAGRSKAPKEGMHQGRPLYSRLHPVGTDSGCTEIAFADGQWRTQT